MGISGLLPLLKSITETKTIDQYKGQTLAIDGYCWLHRAIYSCSQEICLGEETDKYIVYFMDRVNALLQNGVTPYVVFDGGPLPMKKATEEERRKSRAKNKELGLQSLRQKNYAEARKYFVRAADVSPYMAHCVIQRLKAMGVHFVVAPFEADAQLAFLMKNGIVDGVITEDSDCLPFGCAKVLFKMDRDGIAQEVLTANLKNNAGLSFHMFTDEMFLEMCIFSGCDYLASLPGFALKKAYALIKQHGTYTKILRALRMEGKVRIPPRYEAEFERAILTFRHQRVYDSATKKLVPLTPIPADVLEKHDKMDFLGPIIPDDVAQAIAEGEMDPMTLEAFSAPPPPNRHSTLSTTTSHVAHKPAFKPPTAAPVRSLPAWMSRKAHQLSATTPSPSASPPATSAPTAAASTPKTISHFFAARSKTLSPADDSVKAAAPLSRQESTESTYESQEPNEVDVARNLSFSPVDDEVKHMHTTVDAATCEKENAVPNAQVEAAKPANEDAFARMMRAGGVMTAHRKHETSMERIKRHAFSKRSFQDTATVVGSAEQVVEPDTEPSGSAESQIEENSQPCIMRSDVLSERLRVKGDLNHHHSSTAPPQSKALTSPDVFARFRFGSK